MEACFILEASVPTSGAKTIQRALSLLKAFTGEHPTLTLTELSGRSGLSKATVHRLLAALVEEGFVERLTRRQGYRLGPEVIVLGARALQAIDVREVARKEMEILARATGEDTSLESLLGLEVMILDEARGGSLLGILSSVGTRWPAHATATGKVLLAFSVPPPAVKIEHLDRYTDRTIDSWDELSRALEEVRKTGYATNLEELEPGFVSVAAPIRDQEGRVTTAISVGGSVHRIPDGRIPELAAQVCQAAEEISRKLGYREDP